MEFMMKTAADGQSIRNQFHSIKLLKVPFKGSLMIFLIHFVDDKFN